MLQIFSEEGLAYPSLAHRLFIGLLLFFSSVYIVRTDIFLVVSVSAYVHLALNFLTLHMSRFIGQAGL